MCVCVFVLFVCDFDARFQGLDQRLDRFISDTLIQKAKQSKVSVAARSFLRKQLGEEEAPEEVIVAEELLSEISQHGDATSYVAMAENAEMLSAAEERVRQAQQDVNAAGFELQ